MAGDVDHEDKTEEPTEKRLHDAAEKGQIAFSREAPLFASLSAALVAFVFIVPGRAAALMAALVAAPVCRQSDRRPSPPSSARRR